MGGLLAGQRMKNLQAVFKIYSMGAERSATLSCNSE